MELGDARPGGPHENERDADEHVRGARGVRARAEHGRALNEESRACQSGGVRKRLRRRDTIDDDSPDDGAEIG